MHGLGLLWDSCRFHSKHGAEKLDLQTMKHQWILWVKSRFLFHSHCACTSRSMLSATLSFRLLCRRASPLPDYHDSKLTEPEHKPGDDHAPLQW
jgi:hypothetical protein